MTQNTRSQSGNSSLKQAQQKRHARIIRVSAYSVAMVLALLLVNSALPPLLADQSDRAVIDAPITLLTSPIAGEVTSIVGAAGQRLQPNTLVARVENARVDRSTLITLEGKVNELQSALHAGNQKEGIRQCLCRSIGCRNTPAGSADNHKAAGPDHRGACTSRGLGCFRKGAESHCRASAIAGFP